MRQEPFAPTSVVPPAGTTRLGTPDESLSSAQLYVLAALQANEHGLKIAIWSFLRSLLFLERAAMESEWEDVLADVRERALRSAHSFAPQNSVNAWLQTIALNCVRDLKRKRRREILAQDAPLPRKISSDEDEESESDAFDRLQELITPRSEADTLFLDDFLPRVPSAYHQVLRLHLEHGLRGQALAAQLGMTEGAASVKLCRAKVALLTAYERTRTNHSTPGESQ